MNAAGRLALFGGGLAVAFAGAFLAAGAVVPGEVVSAWNGESVGEEQSMDQHDGSTETVEQGEAAAPAGLSSAADGYLLSPIEAPAGVGHEGRLAFTIERAADGAPLTAYTTAHEQDLHLIVVRADGSGYRHVHPELDAATGAWSIPWTWDAAGTYRVFADFTPGAEGASGVTLSRTVDVRGDVVPVQPEPVRVDEVDGFTVTLAGDLTAGASSPVSVSVEHDGRPVTALEPYLGAFGHLVALREGDLAYLHVHADGAEPAAGDTAGPEVAFVAEVPTSGRYLLYFDFQVDGRVHTAAFVVDAASAEAGGGAATPSPEETHAGH